VDNYVDSVSFSSGTLTLGRTGALSGLTTTISLAGVGGTDKFIGLTDTPSNYTSSAGKVVKVNSSGDGLEFVESLNVGKTYDLTVEQTGGNNDNPAIRLSDGTTNDDITITGGSNVTVTRNSGTQFTIAASSDGGGGLIGDVTVDYTGRTSPCTLPITVSTPTPGTKQINIPDNSNAFGAKYIQDSEPSGSSVCDGDIWYDTTSAVSGGGFVAGMIMMFSGTTAPTGWVLCDNSAEAAAANAPDLRDRFIVGAGSAYTIDTTGGSADSTLVSHSHTGTVDGNGGHTHSVNGSGNHSHTYDRSAPGSGTEGGSQGVHDFNSPTSVSGAGGHSHTIGGDGSHSHTLTISPEGNSETNANLPPYYALAFIMKT
jgi:microcystin-dependent protein